MLLLLDSLGDDVDAVTVAFGLIVVVVVMAGKGNCVLGAGMFSTSGIINEYFLCFHVVTLPDMSTSGAMGRLST